MKNKKTIKKSVWNIIALAMILTMAFCLKAEVKADADMSQYLYIDGKFYYDIDKNLSGNGWSYQAFPKKITLNNYNGSEVELCPRSEEPCDVILKGDNTITVDKGHNITYHYPDSSTYTETHTSPIWLIRNDSLLITGSGNLTVNAEQDLPTYNTSYVNCGTIRVVNQKEGYDYNFDYTQDHDSSCVPGCLKKETDSSQAVLVRECLDCGKSLYRWYARVSKLTLSQTHFFVTKGDKIQLNTAIKTTIEPSYLSFCKVFWETEKPDIISIDDNGVATILKEFSDSDGQWAVFANVMGHRSSVSFSYRRKATKMNASNLTKTYSGNAQSFNIGVTCNSGGKLTYSSDNSNITVNSAGKVTVKAKYVGSATITVKAAQTEKYESAVKKITVTVNPTKTSIAKAKNVKGKQIKVSWKKNTSGSGYQIQYSTSKTFAKGNKSLNVKKNSIVKATISKLKKGKTYYVRMRTYKTVSGKKYYSAWSKVKTVKISK